MIRYLAYLVISLVMQLVALAFTPLFVLFASHRMGWCDNRSYQAIAPRLPTWLSWADTPDNPMGLDDNHIRLWGDGYIAQVRGLYRNRLYGFKWTVLSMPIQSTRTMIGNPQIDYKTKTFGTLRIKQPNGAWQYKLVKPFLGKIIVLNFGWLLDDENQEKALFMFSPRIKKVS